MRRPRVLILSASVGGGHTGAARATERAFYEISPECAVRHVDVMDLAPGFFRRLYADGYFDAVAHAPHLVGYLYDRLDRPVRKIERPFDLLRLAIQRVNLKGLAELLNSEPWDLVIHTHFLAPEIIGALYRGTRIPFRQATVLTDFECHRFWTCGQSDHYFVATEECRASLGAWGVPFERITVSGIPVDPQFAQVKSKIDCRSRLGLRTNRPVILQMAGGLGIGPICQIHQRILEAPFSLHVVAVTARNDTARQSLADVSLPSRHERSIQGFVNHVDELMAAADLIVTKPGGLTSSEALARGLPMMIVHPIPGQETRNSDYLLENGAAVKVNNLASLPHKLNQLLADPQRLSAMRAAARQISRPRAAFDVAEKCISILQPLFPCNTSFHSSSADKAAVI